MLLNSGSRSCNAKGPQSASVISVCGRRRATGRRVNVQYILDLLAFAVETGRLTEACADVVRHIIQHPSDHDELTCSGVIQPPPSSAASLSAAESCWQPPSSGHCVGVCSLPCVDEETVLREVRFRKTYHGLLQRATPCGFNPYDKTISGPNSGGAADADGDINASSSRFYPHNQGAFEITSSGAGLEIFGDFDTLEDLLAKLELCRGTPPESIKQAVRVKRELVGHLLRRGGALTRPNMYKRLARALDQRVPPDQRLLPTQYEPTQVRKQSYKVDQQPLPSCWHRKTPAGSQLFLTPTKLSDFMNQNDQT